MNRDDEQISFDGEIVHRTDKAVLFHVDLIDEEIWFPLSQIEIATSGDSILVPRWLAKAKGCD